MRIGIKHVIFVILTIFLIKISIADSIRGKNNYESNRSPASTTKLYR